MDSDSIASLLQRPVESRAEVNSPWKTMALLTGLTLSVLLVDGYHPYAEDGGVYVAGIEKLLHPELFPAFTAFTTEHLRFSLFAPVIAALVRMLHLSLAVVLLLVYVASVYATLAAGWSLMVRVTGSVAARAGAVLLLAGGIAVPVAGTSLMLTDPYLTARSLSTPLCLFALAFTLDFLRAQDREGRRSALAAMAACLLGAAAVHPLMAAYGLAAVIVLLCACIAESRRRWLTFAVLTGLALLLAAAVQLAAQRDSAIETYVAMTRYYWFPFRWQWFEQLGLLGPVVVLALLARRLTPVAAALARCGTMLAIASTAVALLFCRAHYGSHLVARLQPLRCFGTVYLLMLLLLGAFLGERWMRGHLWRWTVLAAALAGLMFSVDRQTFPASAHLELPGRSSPNLWVQAFEWIQDRTPEDAVFALDAHYITVPGEDAQCFRAIAQRSALPDYSKDGGEASITPSLTPAWIAGQSAQTGLSRDSDTQRRAALLRLEASWVVLRSDAATGFPCPYTNAAVKVCRID